MKRNELLKFMKDSFDEMYSLCERKNDDYAGASVEQNAFHNFMMIEHMGACSAEVGMLTRMSDKMARIAKFVTKGDYSVKDESITDTLRDLANYSVLLSAVIKWKADMSKKTVPDSFGESLVVPKVRKKRVKMIHLDTMKFA